MNPRRPTVDLTAPCKSDAAAKPSATALTASIRHYKTLYDDNPSMYFTVDHEGTVLSVNRFGAEQLGYEVEELVGRSIFSVFHTEDRAEVRVRLATCVTQLNKVHQWEIRKVRKDATVLWVKETARGVVIPEDGEIVLVVCEDITERKQAQADVQESEARYRSVVEDMPALICRFLPNGTLTFVNEHYCRYFNKRRAELEGHNFFQFIPEEERERVRTHFASLTPQSPVVSYEHKVLAPDGTHRWQHWTDRGLFDERGCAVEYQSIGGDITERKEAEKRLREYQDQLRTLASEVSLAEERERRRIAAELHDRTVQNLGLSRFKLGALRKSLSACDQSPILDEIQAIIEQTIQDTRSLIFELSPPVLYELGFEPAIEWLAERMQEKYGITCEVENDRRAKPLSKEAQVVLFQAVRELLTNVGKHAMTRQAKVSLQRQDPDIIICVEDDGVGSSLPASGSQTKRLSGFGLFSIRERLLLFEGQVEIDSAHGQGTRVKLTVPLSL